MRRMLLTLLPSLLLSAFGTNKTTWAPVAPEIWAMKGDPSKVLQGAVVLEDKYEIGESKVIRTFRVRILSDKGRDAANLFLFLGDSPKIEGHTLYPDGKVVEFDSVKDFSVKPLVQTARMEARRTAVVAPGINGDCVFEARWEEVPLGAYYSRFIQYLGGKFTVQRAVIEIAKDLPRSYMVIPGKGIRTEVVDDPKFKRFTLLDLPPQEDVTFGLAVTRDLPRIVVFTRQMTRALSKKLAHEQDPRKRADLFWNDYATENLKPDFEDHWHTGDAYKALRNSLFVDLPQAPHARASAILKRLNTRLRNSDQSTFAEAAANKGIHNTSDWLDYVNSFRTSNLEVIAQLGVTTKYGIRAMYYFLLKEAGLQPLIGLVADRDLLLFDYNTLDTNQYTHLLIGVDEPGKGVLWLDPTLRFAAPGLILPDYQGTSGVMINSSTWKATPFTVPVQPALVNQREFRYQVTLDEEGESFSVVADFAGIPEYFARNRLLALDEPGQNRLLKEDLERELKNLTLSKTEVFHAQDQLHNLSWKAEGHLDLDPSRVREVLPFPAMSMPLGVPDELPGDRTEPILIPFRCTHLAISRFEVPQGYICAALPSIRNENRFGSVNWRTELESKDGSNFVNVVLRVDVAGFYEKPEAYADLKTFLAWIKEVSHKTVLLERTR
ncbi:MAG TPA: hypothetical protein VJ486_07060 [Geothrix sp.]|nr:hypothetical protein [Geothrix sp.]